MTYGSIINQESACVQQIHCHIHSPVNTTEPTEMNQTEFDIEVQVAAVQIGKSEELNYLI